MRAARRHFLIFILLLAPANLFGYSVLSHEELIDISWDTTIRPALLKRFPSATEEEVQKAHAYAYGGCVIQDIGYYRSEEHTSELQSRENLVCRLLLEKKKKKKYIDIFPKQTTTEI